jgi:hypothetical protein
MLNYKWEVKHRNRKKEFKVWDRECEIRNECELQLKH